jgi:hypothetical protein
LAGLLILGAILSQRHSHFALLGFIGISLSIFQACQKQEAPPPPFVPNTGQIQVLNGCGIAGAAEVFRDFLIDEGFDIIEFGNAPAWNYPKTMVIARTGDDKVARSLAQVMGTSRLLHLKDADALVEATVIVGKDYEELVRKWQRPIP